MERGLSNVKITKSLGIPESTTLYYRKRPIIKEIKKASKLPQKYIDMIYETLQIRQQGKCLED